MDDITDATRRDPVQRMPAGQRDEGPTPGGDAEFVEELDDWLADHLMGEFGGRAGGRPVRRLGLGAVPRLETTGEARSAQRVLARGVRWPRRQPRPGAALPPAPRRCGGSDWVAVHGPRPSWADAHGLRGRAPQAAVPAADHRGHRHVVPGLSRARRRAPTSPASAPGPSSTATSGWSTARRCGRSLGHVRRLGFLLARTDPDAPKHKGISYLLVPIDQPGVDVRPIRSSPAPRSSTRCSSTTPAPAADLVVGEVGQAWRGGHGHARVRARRRLAAPMQLLVRAQLDDLMRLARAPAYRRPGDPRRARPALDRPPDHALHAQRTCRAAATRPGPARRSRKLYWAQLAPAASASCDAGAAARSWLVGDDPAARHRRSQQTFLFGRAGTISGGASEIQRNIIGERVLGLPK